jgi:hypothetical protein
VPKSVIMEDIQKIKIDTDELIDAFGLQIGVDCAILEKWLSSTFLLSETMTSALEKLRVRIHKEDSAWNEEELKMRFLAFLFDYADLEVPKKIKLFYERPLSAVIDGYTVNVKCDCLLATPKGIGTPRNPYFFLQEFKKRKKNDDDAEGQMLAAMLVAQKINDNQQPIYGAFLQGRIWQFATLHDKNYCVSDIFDAAKTTDLHQIFFALLHLKEIILKTTLL